MKCSTSRHAAGTSLAILFTLSGISMIPESRATTYVWSPTAGSNAWNTSSNWAGNAAPPISGLGNSDIVFNASSATYPTLASTYSVDSVTFNAASNGYDFDAGSLVLGANGVTQNSASTETFDIPVSLGAASTWTIGSAGTGALNFDQGLASGSYALTINSSGNNAIGGAISGSGGITKTGAGILELTGTSNYAGGVAITSGTLAVNTGSVTLQGALGVGAGAALSISGTGSVTLSGGNAYTAAGGTPTSPAIIALSGGSYVDDGPVMNNVIFTQTGGSYNTGTTYAFALGSAAGSNGIYILSGGTLTVPTGIRLGDYGSATFTQNGGFCAMGTPLFGAYAGSSGTFNLNGGTTALARNIAGSGTGIVNFNGGTLQATMDEGTFLGGLTTANVRGGGAVIDTNSYAITVPQNLLHTMLAGDPATDGGLVKLGAGTLTLTGANTYTGGTVIKAGILAVVDDSYLGNPAGPVTIQPGATLSFSSSAVTTARTFYLGTASLVPPSGGSLTYSSGSSIHGGTLGAGSHVLTGNVTLDGTRTTTGTVLSQTSGSATFNNATLSGNTTFSQSGAYNVTTTGDFITTPLTTLTLSGVIKMAGAYLSGMVSVNSSGRLDEANAAGSTTPLYLDGSRGLTINNGGQLNAASGSTIELGGLLTNNGTQTGVLNVNLGGVVEGSGTFGTVNLASTSTFTATGTITGALTVANGALVSLSGSGSTLTVNGALTNNGVMRFERGASLAVTSGATNTVNNGTIDVITGELSLPAGFTNNGLVLDSSVVRVKSVGYVPGGDVTVSIDSYPEHTYQLQRSSALANASYSNVGDPQNGATGTALTFTDPSPTPGQGFYRVAVDL